MQDYEIAQLLLDSFSDCLFYVGNANLTDYYPEGGLAGLRVALPLLTSEILRRMSIAPPSSR